MLSYTRAGLTTESEKSIGHMGTGAVTRMELRRLIDELPERDLRTALRFVEFLIGDAGVGDSVEATEPVSSEQPVTGEEPVPEALMAPMADQPEPSNGHPPPTMRHGIATAGARDASAHPARPDEPSPRRASPTRTRPSQFEAKELRRQPAVRHQMEVLAGAQAAALAQKLDALDRMQADIARPRLEALEEQMRSIVEQPHVAARGALEILARELDEVLKAPVLESLARLEEDVTAARLDAIQAAADELIERYRKLPPDLRRTIDLPSIAVTPEIERVLFDQEAQKLLGMSGEDFLSRWDAGEYLDLVDAPDHSEVRRLATLIPRGR